MGHALSGRSARRSGPMGLLAASCLDGPPPARGRWARRGFPSGHGIRERQQRQNLRHRPEFLSNRGADDSVGRGRRGDHQDAPDEDCTLLLWLFGDSRSHLRPSVIQTTAPSLYAKPCAAGQADRGHGRPRGATSATVSLAVLAWRPDYGDPRMERNPIMCYSCAQARLVGHSTWGLRS
jgi:hypothetical protein